MIPWELIDTSSIPGSAGDLRLWRRGAEFSIRLGPNELMNSRLSGSEEALATLTCNPLVGIAGAKVLIGGLGMGFTLRAALGVLDASAKVVVSELGRAVVSWARGPMAPVFAGSLEDPRVTIIEKDVAEVMGARGSYDAILLDVDNGPEGFTRAANDGLYDRAGLSLAWTALKPGGVLAVWSSGPDAAFTARLRRARYDVDEVRVKAHAGRRGARHTIWLAKRS